MQYNIQYQDRCLDGHAEVFIKLLSIYCSDIVYFTLLNTNFLKQSIAENTKKIEESLIWNIHFSIRDG